MLQQQAQTQQKMLEAVSGTIDRLEYKMERLTQKVSKQSSPQASPFKRAPSKLNNDPLAQSLTLSQRETPAEKQLNGFDTMRSQLSPGLRSPSLLGSKQEGNLRLNIGDAIEANFLN